MWYNIGVSKEVDVMELADITDLKFVGRIARKGSSPFIDTNYKNKERITMKFFENVASDSAERETLLNELNELFREKSKLQNKITEIQNQLVKFYPLEEQKSKTISRDTFKVTLKQNYSSDKFDDDDVILSSVDKEDLKKYFGLSIKPKKKLPKDLPEQVEKIYKEHLQKGEPTSISVSVKSLEE